MTKSIVITYQEADESFLMTFFKKFGIQTNAFKKAANADESTPVIKEITFTNGQNATQKELPEIDELDILPPRKNIDLSTLIGGFKNKMTIDEIDSLTKNWRNEWEQDFS